MSPRLESEPLGHDVRPFRCVGYQGHFLGPAVEEAPCERSGLLPHLLPMPVVHPPLFEHIPDVTTYGFRRHNGEGGGGGMV